MLVFDPQKAVKIQPLHLCKGTQHTGTPPPAPLPPPPAPPPHPSPLPPPPIPTRLLFCDSKRSAPVRTARGHLQSLKKISQACVKERRKKKQGTTDMGGRGAVGSRSKQTSNGGHVWQMLLHRVALSAAPYGRNWKPGHQQHPGPENQDSQRKL